MSKGQMLRALVKQRLSLAAEEIFDLFERTIAEYEEQLCRSKEENERQRKLLDAVFKPQLRLHRAGDVQQLSASHAEVPPEPQERSSSLNQEDPPELPHIKEEQKELWTNQEGGKPQALKEADLTEITFIVKREDEDEDDEEYCPSQTDEVRETKAPAEVCGGPEPGRDSDPDGHLQPEEHFELETEVSNDDRTSREAHLGLNILNSHRYDSVAKPYRCSVCGKRFSQNSNMKTHMRTHTGEKPFSCSVCGKRFVQKAHVINHFKRHTGEKPFSCSLCDKRFTRYEHLRLHMRTHTGEKPYSCRVCGERFTWRGQLRYHKCDGSFSQL